MRQKTPDTVIKKSAPSLKLATTSDKTNLYSQKASFIAKKHPITQDAKTSLKKTSALGDKQSLMERVQSELNVNKQKQARKSASE